MTTLDAYDPETGPDRAAWLALDEQIRNRLVAEYHRVHRVPLPRSARQVHAMIHAVVETQLAQEDLPAVRDALQRLLDAGASRHDAIHAIGTVLMRYFLELFRGAPKGEGEDEGEGDHAAFLEAIDQLGRPQ